LELAFVPCNQTGNPECKSVEEYKKWIKGKFFMVLYNKVMFNPNGFHNETFKEEITVDG